MTQGDSMVPAPADAWELIWLLIGPLLTPWLALTLILVIGGAHFVKTVAPVWWPEVVEGKHQWRAFSWTATLAVGSVGGTVLWLSEPDAAWWAVVAVPILAGLVWSVAQGVLPERVADTLRTHGDRKWRRGVNRE